MLGSEKKQIIESLLKEQPDMYDSQIARIVSSEPDAVAKIRQELAATGQVLQRKLFHRTLRSDFLVHWTGGEDIEVHFRDGIIDGKTRRDRYVERLYTTLVKQKKVLYSTLSTPDIESDLNNGELPDDIQREFSEIKTGQPDLINSGNFEIQNIMDGKWLIRGKRENRNGYTTKYVVKRENTNLNVYTWAHGLWMNWQKIECIPEGRTLINHSWPATCFTEIKLSNTLEHAKRYGYLGFGFTREFVTERFGAPVEYVIGAKERDKGANDNISNNFFKVLKTLEFLEDETLDHRPADDFTLARFSPKNVPCFHHFVKCIKLKDFLEKERRIGEPQLYDPDGGSVEGIFARLRASVTSCAIFVKRMSDQNCVREFELLDEAEWRIPFTMHKAREQAIQMIHGYKQDCRPACMIPFRRRDLKVLILPDDETRDKALDKKNPPGQHIFKWLFRDPANAPTIVTVKECLQF